MVIYIDVLIFINTILNYAILATADALLKRRCRLWRLLAGAFTGALFSLTVFIDLDSPLFLFIIKAVSSAVITVIVFGFHSVIAYVKAVLMTMCVSLLRRADTLPADIQAAGYGDNQRRTVFPHGSSASARTDRGDISVAARMREGLPRKVRVDNSAAQFYGRRQ